MAAGEAAVGAQHQHADQKRQPDNYRRERRAPPQKQRRGLEHRHHDREEQHRHHHGAPDGLHERPRQAEVPRTPCRL
jgi:hypothetical protein